MSKRWRLQDMTFGQWATAYLGALALCGLLRLLTKFWIWPLLGLPIDFWRGFLLALSAILSAVIVAAFVCAGLIASSAKSKA